jgi:acyl carrier protein
MKLTEIVANVLTIDPSILSDESNAKNTPNWDSARHIDLMLAVEVAFDVQFTMPEITSMQNLGDMRALLTQKGALSSAVAA